MKFIYSFIENNNFLYLHNVWKQSKRLPNTNYLGQRCRAVKHLTEKCKTAK